MPYTKVKFKGKIQYIVHGVFGEGASDIADDESISAKEAKKLIKEAGGEEIFKMFDTPAECDAYVAGIDDMTGWLGAVFTGLKRHKAIFGISGVTILKK